MTVLACARPGRLSSASLQAHEHTRWGMLRSLTVGGAETQRTGLPASAKSMRILPLLFFKAETCEAQACPESVMR